MGVDRARARRLTESENDDDDDRSLDAREEVGDGDDESDEEDVDRDSVVRASLERASERDAEIADERDTRVRILLIRERDAEFARDPKFKSRSIAELNNEAVRYLKAGDDVKCVVAYAKVFRKVSENNVTHPTLYVCHSNRAFAYLNLGLFQEALWDGHRAKTLANERFTQLQDDDGSVKVFVKGYARKGFALMGLREPKLAKL